MKRDITNTVNLEKAKQELNESLDFVRTTENTYLTGRLETVLKYLDKVEC